MKKINLNFKGPFSFTDRNSSIFTAPHITTSGIYLWTIKQKETGYHLIHYIGETSSFYARHKEHLNQILSLNYGILDADKSQNGICDFIWKGFWRIKAEDGYLQRFHAYNGLQPKVLRYVETIDIFFAETTLPDKKLLRNIEGAIGTTLRTKYPEYKVLYPDDNRIIANKEHFGLDITITSSEIIQGLDEKYNI